MTSITSSQSLVLDLPPSCIEFCPTSRDYFVVGTYFLEKKEQDASVENATGEEEEKSEDTDKKPQTRTGSLILFKIEGDEVKLISTTPTPYAILDIHFSPHDPTLLAVAASTGAVQLFRFSASSPALSPLSTYQFFSPEILVLSLAWHPTSSHILGVTASNGGVYTVDVSVAETGAQDTAKEILVHELEAWTLAFSHTGKEVWSGGDDATLRFSTLPPFSTSEEEENFLPTQWQDRRAHNAGVTAILPLANEPNILITGSYDDNIRILSCPQIGRKQVLAEENLEGGVWRLKLLTSSPNDGKYMVLASCMHAGTRIVAVTKDEGGEWGIEVLARFEEHKSMNYGSDVQPGSTDGGEQTVISTSFYDKLLCLWRFDLS
ncbi:WD40 repeat-like protein [Aureobasidium melanogenum CBS 110374]|uniref:methylated diphthine methylhydrolase n=1 Tax=Aureobasidium melanogenum (strain CBS 110374) TaxID=1043003 RepID=A0A074WCV9_AURM1|nr:WD40 repeat-like protein [Aureobasidium melanogenum CBS 110374]KEQ67727.1 WD40 repeat-like protein [Aureobasidium melanogenum CBS 110374]